MTILEAFIYSILGMVVVFFALILLMLIIRVMTFFTDRKKKDEPSAAPTPVSSVTLGTAPGSAGELKLYDTEPRTAAMIMAIVADELGYPLNELRFKSIKKVEE